MLVTYKHRGTKQEVVVDDQTSNEAVYKNSVSWVKISGEDIEPETKVNQLDAYSGMTKAQLKDLLTERGISFNKNDKLNDLVTLLISNDELNHRETEVGDPTQEFKYNLT